jgi:hypothetical protein
VPSADGGVLPSGRAQQRAALALPLVHAGEVVSPERLVDAPPTSSRSLGGLRAVVRSLRSDGRFYRPCSMRPTWRPLACRRTSGFARGGAAASDQRRHRSLERTDLNLTDSGASTWLEEPRPAEFKPRAIGHSDHALVLWPINIQPTPFSRPRLGLAARRLGDPGADRTRDAGNPHVRVAGRASASAHGRRRPTLDEHGACRAAGGPCSFLSADPEVRASSPTTLVARPASRALPRTED